jgi:hypothetical protein
MRSYASAIGVALSLLGLARNVAAQDIESCADALYIIVARATLAEEGAGLPGDVADAIAERIPGSIVATLDYPAQVGDEESYTSSVNDGVVAMRAHLNAYHESCPDGRTAVLGFQQVRPMLKQRGPLISYGARDRCDCRLYAQCLSLHSHIYWRLMVANDYTRVAQGSHVTAYSFCADDSTTLEGHELELEEPLSSEIVENSNKSLRPNGVHSLQSRNSSAVVDADLST